ncbi:amidohydrolase [Amycolatopsis umgeniensis]|uniref:Amidohydrolase n=1 Tax=Amycolatopsis umgeniensis TaxID=336628 RepID=A0A841BET0_9PSEU|nr:amidohydrolase [Amycolatopsis umgeniensis]MBB5857510.1 amidohydrolase [Amycolatopsis umgeniensis]
MDPNDPVRGNRGLLIDFRRDLHRHPELSWAEHRTTALLRDRLVALGLEPRTLPNRTGLICDVGDGTPEVLLRADIDALGVSDEKDVPYRSTVPGVAHACGHDVHTTVLYGVALALAGRERLDSAVRLVFQPAEEVMPGGARAMLEAGELDGVRAAYALHCDPNLPVGKVGLRSGPITAACDRLLVQLTGPGGHTARPHLTADLVYALAKIAADVPASLGRRLDPRSGVSLVWGRVSAGSAPNIIPQEGELEGIVRALDHQTWQRAPELIEELVSAIASAHCVKYTTTYHRGVPPVVNHPEHTERLREAALVALGPGSVVTTEQSLGGEDFGWYLDAVPGAMARLGVRGPEKTRVPDLHQGGFDVDERCIEAGVRLLLETVCPS